MKVIDNNTSSRAQALWSRHLYLGVALIVIGCVWMLYNFGVIGPRFVDVFFSWEMLLTVIGGYLLSRRQWVWGGLVTALGLLFLVVDLLGLAIPYDKVAWPAVFIVAGVAVLLTRSYRR